MTAVVDGRGHRPGNEVVGARWGGTREDPHAQPHRARAEGWTRPTAGRELLREVLEPILHERGVRRVTVLGDDPQAALFAELGVGSVAVVARSPSLAVRAAVAANPALELVPDPPAADLYVLTGETGYHGTLRDLERVLAEAPDAVVLVGNLLWPGGRRDVLSGVGAVGPSVLQDELSRAGLGAGAVDAAEVAGGEENGVLTAVEDALAETGDTWTLGIVPVLGGLGVLARDDAWFAEGLWETLLPWTTSELLAGLERARVALLSRVLELEHATTAAARDAARQQNRLTRCLRELDAAWDEIAELRSVAPAPRDSLRTRVRGLVRGLRQSGGRSARATGTRCRSE